LPVTLQLILLWVENKFKKLKTVGPDLEPPYFFKVHRTFVHNFKSKKIKKTVTKTEEKLLLEDKRVYKF